MWPPRQVAHTCSGAVRAGCPLRPSCSTTAPTAEDLARPSPASGSPGRFQPVTVGAGARPSLRSDGATARQPDGARSALRVRGVRTPGTTSRLPPRPARGPLDRGRGSVRNALSRSSGAEPRRSSRSGASSPSRLCASAPLRETPAVRRVALRSIRRWSGLALTIKPRHRACDTGAAKTRRSVELRGLTRRSHDSARSRGHRSRRWSVRMRRWDPAASPCSDPRSRVCSYQA